MQLDLISAKPDTPNGLPPILLVHGAWHGAWCWQGNFLEYFAAQGFETYAMSLRGHGQSEGTELLRGATYKDYVADVKQIVDSLDQRPILIGHSMGGYTVQKYLETYDAVGGVLLGSVPASGTFGFTLHMIRRYPLKWLKVGVTRSGYPFMETLAHAKYWLFSDQISDEEMVAFHPKLQDESFRIASDMMMLNLPKPKKVSTPIAVVAGGQDTVFSVGSLQQTAGAYGVEAKVFADMPHNLMGVPGWQEVADWIDTWIRTL